MVIFELGKEIEKHVFRLGTNVKQKKKIQLNRTSDLSDPSLRCFTT